MTSAKLIFWLICLEKFDSQSRVQASSRANAEGYQEENNLHYSALRNNQPNRSMQNRQNECVYSAVRL
ncbi:hypothetical protein D4764_0122250 [Takifugu flavidus]|uniref:Uncharacterized protein n=1 Tax=Takifugu flavidus TaxID=433684 RepID=A0A5C6MHG0_9TELE|nr:hypothetical protein D4764_0122250 [Takifugu flavidus]